MGKKSFKQEMSELRFAGLGVVLIVVVTAVFIFSGFVENPLDLSNQGIYFGALGVAALIIGLNLGHVHFRERRWWIYCDLLWISLAVLAVGRMLSPLEEHFARQELARAQWESRHAAVSLINDILLER